MHCSCARSNSHRGFSLFELLVVLAIIGAILAILLPAVQAARESARRTNCLSRLRQIATAQHSYYEARRHFPPGTVLRENKHCGTCWTIAILPFLEEQSLFAHYDNEADNDAPENHLVRTTPVTVYTCPSDPRIGNSLVPSEKPSAAETLYMPGSYRGVSGRSEGKFFLDSQIVLGYDLRQRGVLHITGFNQLQPETFKSIRDGSSSTLLVGESVTVTSPGMGTLWANSYLFYIISAITPQSRTLSGDYEACISQPGAFGPFPCKRGWGSAHPRVLNFALADGSARSVATTVDMEVLARMATIMGEDKATLAD